MAAPGTRLSAPLAKAPRRPCLASAAYNSVQVRACRIWDSPTTMPVTSTKNSVARSISPLKGDLTLPRSQTPVWERSICETPFRSSPLKGRNRVSEKDVPKQEFGNEESLTALPSRRFFLPAVFPPPLAQPLVKLGVLRVGP